MWRDALPCDGTCTPGTCPAAGMTFGGYVFAGCPVRALDARPGVDVLARLWRARSVAPLAEFPHGLAAWVTRGLVVVADAVDARRAQEADR